MDNSAECGLLTGVPNGDGMPFEETSRRPRGLPRVSWTGCDVSTDTLP
jgi:hypothetical protein